VKFLPFLPRTLRPARVRMSTGLSSTCRAMVPATAKSAMISPFRGLSAHWSNSSRDTPLCINTAQGVDMQEIHAGRLMRCGSVCGPWECPPIGRTASATRCSAMRRKGASFLQENLHRK